MCHYSKEIKINAIKTAPTTCPKCSGDIIFDDNCLVITCMGFGFEKGCGSVFEYNRYYGDDSVYYWEEFIEDEYDYGE